MADDKMGVVDEKQKAIGESFPQYADPERTIRQGWKIVVQKHPDDDTYYSAIMGYSRWAVQYEIDVWTEPQYGCGPLCVFDKRHDILELLSQIPEYIRKRFRIFRCEYRLSSRLTPSYPKQYFATELSGLPKGTVLAEQVRLIGEPTMLDDAEEAN